MAYPKVSYLIFTGSWLFRQEMSWSAVRARVKIIKVQISDQERVRFY